MRIIHSLKLSLSKTSSVLILLSLLQSGHSLAASSIDTGQPQCGSITIADMNWNSATFSAHLDQFILHHVFGCEAELVPGDTMPTGTSMIEKGEPDIAPELWTNSFKEGLERGIKEGRIVRAGNILKEGGEEGFWLPRYMVEKQPELATIEGIRKHARLFKHPEEPDRSAMIGCPAGWACQLSVGNLFKALRLADEGFELIDPGSSAGLTSSLAKAYVRGESWLGYYWAPTAAIGRYDMVKVDFGSGIDADHFYKCIAQAECNGPKATMYPRTEVISIASKKFAKRHPAAMAYIQQRSFSNNQLSKLLAWMDENQANGEEVMLHFLKTQEPVWNQWLSPEQVSLVKKVIATY